MGTPVLTDWTRAAGCQQVSAGFGKRARARAHDSAETRLEITPRWPRSTAGVPAPARRRLARRLRRQVSAFRRGPLARQRRSRRRAPAKLRPRTRRARRRARRLEWLRRQARSAAPPLLRRRTGRGARARTSSRRRACREAGRARRHGRASSRLRATTLPKLPGVTSCAGPATGRVQSAERTDPQQHVARREPGPQPRHRQRRQPPAQGEHPMRRPRPPRRQAPGGPTPAERLEGLREQQEHRGGSEHASVSARQRPRAREVTNGKHTEGQRHGAVRDGDSPTPGARTTP
jgi:hypothetical protein